jgi:hypothetical protein
MNNPPKNSKLKPISLRRREKEAKGESLLPVIRQLSIQDREKTTTSKKFRTVINFRKKAGKRMEGGLGTVGAWEGND